MQVLTDGFECSCITGYTGALCELRVNGCQDNTCLNGATCYVRKLCR